MSRGGLILGSTGGGRVIRLSARDRELNLLLIGPPRSGKTGALINFIIQAIVNNEGMLVICPDGGIIDFLARFIAKHRLHRRRQIHLIDPHIEGYCLGFDPLDIDEVPDLPPYIVDAQRLSAVDDAVAVIEAIFDAENTLAKPQLRKVLRCIFYALAVHRLPITEAAQLATAVDFSGLRTALTTNLPNAVMQAYWTDFNSWPPQRLAELFASAMNRLAEVIAHPLVARMLGQKRRTLNLRKAVAEGAIILANLRSSPRFSLAASRLTGAMLLSKLINSALDRDEREAKKRPFHVFIDELPMFASPDIAFLLDRLRKRGIHLTAAMQRLGQLREQSPSVANALLAGMQSQMVFRVEADDDAVALAPQLFRSEYDLEQVKREAPAVVGYHREIFEGGSAGLSIGGSAAASRSRSETSSWGSADTQGSGENWSEGTNAADHGGWSDPTLLGFGPQQATLPQTWDSGRSNVSGGSRSASHIDNRNQATSSGEVTSDSAEWGASATHSYHEALVPEIEWLPAEFKGYQEVEHEFIALLRDLGEREAVVKTTNRRAQIVRTLDNPDAFTTPAKLARCCREILEASAYTSPSAEIEAEIDERRRRLRALTHGPALVPAEFKEGWG